MIDYTTDQGITTSEGQAYGLFFCLVAGDRARFNQILAWTDANLAAGRLGPRLPGWKWGRDAAGWKLLSTYSASDADSWISYCLLSAGQLWGDRALTSQGLVLARTILAQESVTLAQGRTLLPGQTGFPSTPPVLINPSYLPLFLVNGLATPTADPGWSAIAQATPDIIVAIAKNGFAPDWARLPDLPSGQTAHLPTAGVGSFDAIRTYLWAGLTAPATPQAGKILTALFGMRGEFVQNRAPPERVEIASGAARGLGGLGFYGALLPYLWRLPGQTGYDACLKAVLSARQSSGLFGAPANYYAESLILFGLGGVSGAFAFGPDGRLLLP